MCPCSLHTPPVKSSELGRSEGDSFWVARTPVQQGGLSRNKVSVGEPADGSPPRTLRAARVVRGLILAGRLASRTPRAINHFFSSYHDVISGVRVIATMMAAARSAVLSEPIVLAGDSLARGEPVLLYDAPEREGETDLVILSERATPELVRLLRRDAGGLICTALPEELRARLGLPFASDLLELAEPRFPIAAALRRQRLRYDQRSAFGISVNHRTNFTGVPDNDRAVTIRSLGEVARDSPHLTDAELVRRFADEFTSPGHVPLLYAAGRLMRERKGHTELAISLARMAGLSESTTVCEMLGDSGGPRSPRAAQRYAEDHGWLFLEGRTVAEAWNAWSA